MFIPSFYIILSVKPYNKYIYVKCKQPKSCSMSIKDPEKLHRLRVLSIWSKEFLTIDGILTTTTPMDWRKIKMETEAKVR